MLVPLLLAVVVLLIAIKADKVGLLAIDTGGELLLAYHEVPPTLSTTTEYQHQAFIR
jgi:hypothetical protein